MNLYEIVNTETGEIVIDRVGYSEAQRYMQTNNLSSNSHEIKLYMPVKRKTVTGEEVQEITASAIEFTANPTESHNKQGTVYARFKTEEAAMECADKLANIVEFVDICPNRVWIKYKI